MVVPTRFELVTTTLSRSIKRPIIGLSTEKSVYLTEYIGI